MLVDKLLLKIHFKAANLNPVYHFVSPYLSIGCIYIYDLYLWFCLSEAGSHVKRRVRVRLHLSSSPERSKVDP